MFRRIVLGLALCTAQWSVMAETAPDAFMLQLSTEVIDAGEGLTKPSRPATSVASARWSTPRSCPTSICSAWSSSRSARLGARPALNNRSA